MAYERMVTGAGDGHQYIMILCQINSILQLQFIIWRYWMRGGGSDGFR